MNQENYSRKRTACIALGIILIMLTAFTIFEVNTKPEQSWDISCPMANAKVSWQQSFHSGAMEVER